MNLDVIVKILADAGVGTLGQDLSNPAAVPIFKNRMAATTTKGIVVKSPIEGEFVDNTLPGYFRTKLQVIVRASKQADGDAISLAVMRALKSDRRRTYKDNQDNFLMQINYLLVDRMPIIYPRDDSDTSEWSINFKISYCVAPI